MLLNGRIMHLAGYAATKLPGVYIIIVAEEGHNGDTVGYFSGTLDLGTMVAEAGEAMELATQAVKAFNEECDQAIKEAIDVTGGNTVAE